MEEQQTKPALVKNPSTGSQRKPGRRVAFEVPSSRILQRRSCSDLSDIHSSIDHLEKGRHHPCCFACCAWACILVFIFIIVLLFAGISYLAFLKAGMPKVNVRSINITRLQVDSSQKMDADIRIGLRISNKNEKLKLLYGPLSVDVTSEDVPLGKAKLKGFSQMPKNDTDLDMTMTLHNADVDKYAADDLKSDINAYEMVFDVYVSGHIGLKVGSLQMTDIPFLASCHQIKQMDVDYGRRPECDVKMFAFRPSSN